MIANLTAALLPSGIPGLDMVLGGGLQEFSFNVIAGAPGSGKTTLAYQVMFALATPERPALYFTVLGEPPIRMLRHQQGYRFFDLDRFNRCIRLCSLTDAAATGNPGKVLDQISQEVTACEPGLVFVDSFRTVLLAGGLGGKARVSLQKFVHDLSVLMTSWQATTFILGEHAHDEDLSPAFTVADGVIALHQSTQHNLAVRKLEIRKMRGQPTLPGLHPFRIGVDGVEVFPRRMAPMAASALRGAATDRRLDMGVSGLNEMMGGGLPRGYSLLVAGPSGSGKSILAAAFLAEGVRRGEAGVIAAFEQRSHTSRGPVLASLIERGRVGLVDTSSPAMSVEEIAWLLLAEIRRLNAVRVVIDSLSGFELALAPTFRGEFRQALSRMVVALAAEGVSVVMVSELEDRYNDLRFSPYGTAFLTDAIIVQRYIEIDGRLQRVLAVVKMRASAHSNVLRLFHIDDNGLQLDGMLPGYEGLLRGQPTRRIAHLPSAGSIDDGCPGSAAPPQE
jgi:circadian clock protein KaiC